MSYSQRYIGGAFAAGSKIPLAVLARRVAIYICVLTLSACVAIPLPRSVPAKIDETDVATIRAGVTTSREIRQQWGEPDFIWRAERIWIYNQGPSGQLLWIIGGTLTAMIALTDMQDDIIIMQFSKAGTVQRLERRLGPANPSNFGRFLQDWVDEHEAKDG